MYRERLWPTFTWFLTGLLLIPAVILMLAPVNFTLAIVSSVIVYLGLVLFLVAKSPTVSFDGTTLRAGRGHIHLNFLELATPITGDAVFPALHTELDARAWLCIRGWAKGVVRIELNDPDDPTPYWMVSSRHPERLAETINAARAAHATAHPH